jgi:hypothetical protein
MVVYLLDESIGADSAVAQMGAAPGTHWPSRQNARIMRGSLKKRAEILISTRLAAVRSLQSA